MEKNLARIIGIARHRLSDGDGVFVAFYGCTFHCHYCLNPATFSNSISIFWKGDKA